MSLVSLVEDNLFEKLGYWVQKAPGMVFEKNRQVTLALSGLQSSMFNVVCRARFQNATEIDQCIDRFGALPFAWWVGPSGEPKDLGSLLVQKGLKKEGDELGMALELKNQPLSVGAIQIHQVVDLKHINHFCSVLAEYDSVAAGFYKQLFDLRLCPDSKAPLFIGMRDNKCVALGSLFFTGEVAGVFDIITHPAERRKGYATSVTEHLISFAKKQGAKWVTLSASNEQAARVYRRLGFKSYAAFECFEKNI